MTNQISNCEHFEHSKMNNVKEFVDNFNYQISMYIENDIYKELQRKSKEMSDMEFSSQFLTFSLPFTLIRQLKNIQKCMDQLVSYKNVTYNQIQSQYSHVVSLVLNGKLGKTLAEYLYEQPNKIDCKNKSEIFRLLKIINDIGQQ